jgi:hypothetical protein
LVQNCCMPGKQPHRKTNSHSPSCALRTRALRQRLGAAAARGLPAARSRGSTWETSSAMQCERQGSVMSSLPPATGFRHADVVPRMQSKVRNEHATAGAAIAESDLHYACYSNRPPLHVLSGAAVQHCEHNLELESARTHLQKATASRPTLSIVLAIVPVHLHYRSRALAVSMLGTCSWLQPSSPARHRTSSSTPGADHTVRRKEWQEETQNADSLSDSSHEHHAVA